VDTDDKNIAVTYAGENERTVETENSKIYLRRSDPYGFWHVSFERGSPPSHLTGAFTTLDVAVNAVQNYLGVARSEAIKADRERARTAKTKAA
jgi:hypothetical protein